MEVFGKLYTATRRKLGDLHKSRDLGRSGTFSTDQVRVLLFQESDRRGRKLLFDSAQIERVPAGKHDKPSKNTQEVPCIVEVADGYSYIYKGPAADTGVLGDMVFGAVALSHRGVHFKMHYMEQPKRVMCSKVFIVPARRRPSAADSAPADLGPSDNRDSGYFGGQSCRSSVSSGCDLLSAAAAAAAAGDAGERRHSEDLPPHTGSLPRRLSAAPRHNSSGDSQLFGGSSASSTTDSLTSNTSLTRRRKFGVAVIITWEQHQLACVERGVWWRGCLQRAVLRVRAAAARPAARPAPALLAATTQLAHWLHDILYGPRLPSLWLCLITSKSRPERVAEQLVADICHCLAKSDTKQTNFFFSTLVSAVLTHHSGWVGTLPPARAPPPPPPPPPHPLAARTVVTGTDVHYINTLLLVLTYFIRCGELRNKPLPFQKQTKKQHFAPTSTKKTRQVGSELNIKVPELRASGMKKTTSYVFTQSDKPMTSQMKRTPTVMPLKSSSNSSLNSDDSDQPEQNVVFVLGDDEKLVGIKNKSNGGKSVKKSSKIHNEPLNLEDIQKAEEVPKCEKERCKTSPSKCCGQSSPHGGPIKHSGFKFEFDKYPQIVTNYMKSKNLEILDRHYIGKPGNLKLDNFQFDPTIVPPIQEERCETCLKCEMMESMLQTPTNASELEYTNDVHQYATPTVEKDPLSKSFVRRKKPDTLIVNVTSPEESCVDKVTTVLRVGGKEKGDWKERRARETEETSVQPASLLGGLTDHYVPELVLQGTTEKASVCLSEMAVDLQLWRECHVTGQPALALLADTDNWQVLVVGAGGAGGGAAGGAVAAASAAVAAALEAVPRLRDARVPALQCLSHIESSLLSIAALSLSCGALCNTRVPTARRLTTALRTTDAELPLLLSTAAHMQTGQPVLTVTYT